MKLSARLKQWLVANAGCKATASEDEFRSAAAKSLADGTLSVEEYKELSTTKADKEADEFANFMKTTADTLAELTKLVKPAETKSAVADPEEDDDDEDEAPAKSAKPQKEGHTFLEK